MHLLGFINYWIEKFTVKHWNAYNSVDEKRSKTVATPFTTRLPDRTHWHWFVYLQIGDIIRLVSSPVPLRNYYEPWVLPCRSQWPRGLRLRSAAARLLRLWVRIPPRAWMFVCCECCVLTGRGLCDEPITRAEESYRLWRVVCDLETLWMRKPLPTGGCRAQKQTWVVPYIRLR